MQQPEKAAKSAVSRPHSPSLQQTGPKRRRIAENRAGKAV
jgi:hypothetical protein